MFTPLLIGFVGLFIGINDLKHPVINHDQCVLVGRGLSLKDFKTHAKTLYVRQGEDENDLGFHCQKKGDIVINDEIPLPLQEGKLITLTDKQFKYFPQRYYLEIPVVNSDEEELKTTHP